MCGLCWLEVASVITYGCLALCYSNIANKLPCLSTSLLHWHNVESDGEAMVEGKQKLAGTGLVKLKRRYSEHEIKHKWKITPYQ